MYLSWPLEGIKQTSFASWAVFGATRIYPGNHEGLDLHANEGDMVLACAGGRVVWASDQRRTGGDSLYGNHIIIEHIDGLITWYAHLSIMSKKAGDVVQRADGIGRVGNTGVSSGPHLHLTIQHIGHGHSGYVIPDVVDPLKYLNMEMTFDLDKLATSMVKKEIENGTSDDSALC